MQKIVKSFLDEVGKRNQNEPEFMQAVTEVAETVIPYIVKNDIYYGQNILLRMAEPERVLSFRVAWIDDNEEIQLVQKEYLRLAQLLWDGTDPLAPKPLEDRDIFELLGFD